MQTIKLFKKSSILIAILIVLYTVAMIFTSLIPNSLVEKNVKVSLDIIKKEGSYPTYSFNTPASRLDNFTDERMVLGALTDDSMSVLENSMIIEHRTQYWQGYLFFLKPLFLFFNLYQIRYILYLLFFILFIITNLLICKKINVTASIAYTFAILTSNVLATSVSLQFIGIYLIMFLSIIILLKYNKFIIDNPNNLILFFLLIGSVTCFIDFLTAPLITLGIPLCLVVAYKIINNNNKAKENFKNIILFSISWGIGYAITFIGKWIIACILLQENVFVSSLNQGLIRFNSEEKIELSRITMLKINLNGILGFDNFSAKEILITLIIAILLIGILRHFIPGKFKKSNLILLIIALYPYVWYVVLANHSQIHYWFTYRNQVITIFVVTYLLLSNINLNKLLESKETKSVSKT